MNVKIQPIILSGGSGTRLWPLSRKSYPKHLLPLVTSRSMLQETVLRVADQNRFEPPIIVCSEEHRFAIGEQLQDIDVVPRAIILEPVGRNTAPAVTIAALVVVEKAPESLLLVLPSDHVIANTADFLTAVDQAAVAARQRAIVTFGITPTEPETGYGYIRAGTPLADAPGCRKIESFVEKPDRKTAEGFLAQGSYYWNSGMFLFRVDAYLAELDHLAHAILAGCREALATSKKDLDFLRLGRDAFGGVTATSIDYAVMERTDLAAVVPADIGWSDVGSWSSLWSITDRNEAGNVVVGDVIARDVHDSYIRADSHLVAAIGVNGLVVVATEDAVLLAPKARAQEVKQIVESLERAGRPEAILHRKVHRPWGSYQGVDSGVGFQVKRITVKPGAKLSLQRHAKRAEHWIVVRGTARVTIGDKVFMLEQNQSTYVPLGTVHRLENPGNNPLDIVEVQTGSYLGEDDIVRIDDVYGRTA
jgi:mannose-1-phosphate guanylyltransferase/mannose-6-phosphate isomerase